MEKTVNNFRYERKFLVNETRYENIEALVKIHPIQFREIYQPRFVNNIYLDTFNLDFYYDNIIGTADRKKIRIRWYNNLFGEIKYPILEYKIKMGLVGTKLSYALAPFSLLKTFKYKDLLKVFSNSNLPQNVIDDLKGLNVVLLNCYHRKYFQCQDKKYRITLDRNLRYYDIKNVNNNFIKYFKDKLATIIELKYAVSDDDYANRISDDLKFRLTKNSKYVNGVDLLKNTNSYQ
jgi:hypothetical protein